MIKDDVAPQGIRCTGLGASATSGVMSMTSNIRTAQFMTSVTWFVKLVKKLSGEKISPV